MNYLQSLKRCHHPGRGKDLTLLEQPFPVLHSPEPEQRDSAGAIIQKNFVTTMLPMQDAVGFDLTDNGGALIDPQLVNRNDAGPIKIMTGEITQHIRDRFQAVFRQHFGLAWADTLNKLQW